MLAGEFECGALVKEIAKKPTVRKDGFFSFLYIICSAHS